MSSDDPLFDEAATQFRAFLSAEGWPTVITWGHTSNVVRTSGEPITIESIEAGHEIQAGEDYDAARYRGLGVCFDAVCTIGDTTCATVLWPADPLEAERLMYPSDGGLKLSVAVPRTEGRIRSTAGSRTPLNGRDDR